MREKNFSKFPTDDAYEGSRFFPSHVFLVCKELVIDQVASNPIGCIIKKGIMMLKLVFNFD